jgi:hypothetical protein
LEEIMGRMIDWRQGGGVILVDDDFGCVRWEQKP